MKFVFERVPTNGECFSVRACSNVNSAYTHAIHVYMRSTRFDLGGVNFFALLAFASGLVDDGKFSFLKIYFHFKGVEWTMEGSG